MLRRLPVLPTLLVLIAVAVMVRLGFWQLDRLAQKQALMAHYAAAGSNRAEVAWPLDAALAEQVMFRRSRIDCRPAAKDAPLAGHNRAGETGWAHSFACTLPEGGHADVVIGWSRDLALRNWSGGTVTGVIAPGANHLPRLIADPPLAGLEANAAPDPRDVPNNHLAYAVQWFLFAGTALVIYALALRKRLAAGARGG